MLTEETFKALGDAVRLEMIRRLSDGTTHTIGSVSGNLGLTRQGARKHLQVLADVQLVSLQPSGRQIEVKLDPSSLVAAKTFIAEIEFSWDRRLRTLKDFVEEDTLGNG